MMRKKAKVTLADIIIGKGQYGIGAAAVSQSPNLPTYLRITDINDDGTINKKNLKSVNDIKASNYYLKFGDVVFARTGNSTGRSYVYKPSDGEFVYAGFLIKYSLDLTKVNPNYFAGVLQTEYYKNWVRGHSTGSTRGNINAEGFLKFEFNLLSLEEQNRIADILTSLDDKIELNNQMNQTLEEMAKVLYKQWFVDFEFPNEDGKPYKSSGGEMAESELGLIPKDWKVYQLGTFIKFIKGKKPIDISLNKEETYERYMTIKGISNSEILYANPTNTVKIQNNEICIIMDGASSGDVYTNVEGILGSTFAKIETDLPTGFIFQLFKYHESAIKEHLTGSAIPHTDKGYVNRIKIAIPEVSGIENLSRNLELYTKLMNKNKKNIKILEQQKKIILNEIFKV